MTQDLCFLTATDLARRIRARGAAGGGQQRGGEESREHPGGDGSPPYAAPWPRKMK